MQVSRTVRKHRHTSRAARVCAGIVLCAGAVQADVATRTAEALALYPDGGYGLELAIGRILDSDAAGRSPHAIAEEIVRAGRSAGDEQVMAIGRALAARARELAESDPAESRAILAVVKNARNAVLQKSFRSAAGRQEPGLAVPSGYEGSWFDTTSPE